MNRRPLFLLLLCLPGLPASTAAQTFSYDGNRWYEIEVSIFSNEALTPGNELVIPEKTKLAYPEPILQLLPASSSFRIDFEAAANDSLPPGPEPPVAVGAKPFIGPPEAPAGGEFRLTDFARDPYIALGSAQETFLNYNDRINRAPEHRLLFHAVWRQPVLNLVQSTAIFVAGGDRYGPHNELEGSLRFSYNVNRVDVEAKLWLATFGGVATGRERWQLPPQPFLPHDAGSETSLFEYGVTSLAYMEQVRPMTSNTLHYLDHPALGMLVQIRPYQLPEPVSFSFE